MLGLHHRGQGAADMEAPAVFAAVEAVGAVEVGGAEDMVESDALPVQLSMAMAVFIVFRMAGGSGNSV
jgi:hypothetical protein